MLMDQNVKVDVACTFTTEDPNNLAGIINGDLFVFPFSRNMLDKNNLKSFLLMKGHLKKSKYCLIHVHTPVASFITRMASSKNDNVIYTAHGFHMNEQEKRITNKFYYYLEKIAARKTSKLIVINEYDYKTALKLISKDKAQLVNGVGIDENQYTSELIDQNKRDELKVELSIKKKDKVITHIGEFNNNKRQIDVLNAVNELNKYSNDLKVLLIGRGPNLNFIKSKVKEFNLDDKVKVLGYRRDIKELLAITDIGLLVSLREGLPRSVMEMMSMKIPVIVTNIRGNRDLINDKREGFHIPVKSPDKLSEQLLTLIQDDKLREEMGIKGRKKIVNHFSLENILGEMKKIYSNYL